jgi:hypothetical protein
MKHHVRPITTVEVLGIIRSICNPEIFLCCCHTGLPHLCDTHCFLRPFGDLVHYVQSPFVGFCLCLEHPICYSTGRNCNFLVAGYALLRNLLAVVRKAPKHKDLTISAIMYFISLSLISDAVLMQRPSVLYGFENTLDIEASPKQEKYGGPCLGGIGRHQLMRCVSQFFLLCPEDCPGRPVSSFRRGEAEASAGLVRQKGDKAEDKTWHQSSFEFGHSHDTRACKSHQCVSQSKSENPWERYLPSSHNGHRFQTVRHSIFHSEAASVC